MLIIYYYVFAVYRYVPVFSKLQKNRPGLMGAVLKSCHQH
ncbi:hypothetical protein NIASO_14115 [Niabella soli DSM 19437]|uniref:Uncharacterized protein n=1 Tax=Niabella soli DSM 19437 TaxID=929713 RepID=W0F8T8_9BACT|nr:hypothetical protein NIASO_14115 [Niabella soli DSM 19437]